MGGWILSHPYKSISRNHEKGKKSIFFNPRRSPPAATHTLTLPLHHFFTMVSHFASAGFRTHDLSLARKLLYHCTSRSLVSTFILYKTEHKLIIWGPKLIPMKKLSTTKFYNFSRSTTFILLVSPSEVTYKIWISNLRNSNVVFHDKIISNQKVINYKVS